MTNLLWLELTSLHRYLLHPGDDLILALHPALPTLDPPTQLRILSHLVSGWARLTALLSMWHLFTGTSLQEVELPEQLSIFSVLHTGWSSTTSMILFTVEHWEEKL